MRTALYENNDFVKKKIAELELKYLMDIEVVGVELHFDGKHVDECRI